MDTEWDSRRSEKYGYRGGQQEKREKWIQRGTAEQARNMNTEGNSETSEKYGYSGAIAREHINQRRKMKTAEKTKFVTSIYGKEVIQFLAALAILPTSILKNRINSFFCFKSS